MSTLRLTAPRCENSDAAECDSDESRLLARSGAVADVAGVFEVAAEGGGV